MFTGFASENTPAIQVWNFFQTFASTSAPRSVFISDDCSPIQFFKTGASTTNIRLYLPSCPIEGKTITIINARFGSSNQSINIYSSDYSQFGTLGPIFVLGPGATKTYFYSKQFINYGNSAGVIPTGWVSIDSAPSVSANFGAAVIGGSSNVATNVYSVAVGGSSCSATGDNAGILSGSSNTASGSSSSVAGGVSNNASGVNTFIGGGSSNSASGTTSGILSGQDNLSNGTSSAIIGGALGSARSIVGNFIVPGSNAPISNVSGVSQSGMLVLGRATTDGTATVLTNDINLAGTINQVILPNNSAYYFRGSVIANVTGGGNTKAWTFEGAIKRGANAAATSIVGAVITNTIAQDAGASTWTISVAADTTNGGLRVQVTGQAATTIRWVCKVETTEVTY